MTTTPAGWYPDPSQPGQERYWTGDAWGDVRPAVPAETVIVSDRHGAGVRAGGGTAAWIIAACTLGYMLPWAIAVSRGKSNSTAIGVVNLLAGWTFVGWIVALVMACSSHQKFAVTR